MTTPERLRRRQRIETTLLAIMLIAGGLAAFAFDRRDDANEECFRNYIAATSETSQLRAKLVAEESQSFRQVIRDAGTATSRAEFDAALAEAEASWAAIDRMRERNPVRIFDPEVDCQ